jgi:hypothetical protein
MPDTPETAAQPAAEPQIAPKIRAAIDAWFNTHIAGSPVARSVEAWNHLRSVLGHLGAAIATEIDKEI